MTIRIREATSGDFDAIWPIFAEIVERGDTYAYAPETGKDEAERLWMTLPRVTFVCEEDGEILGTYYLKTVARQLGYAAMQFNFVASSNAGAVRLWKTLGFEIVGTLPNAFRHPEQGFVDAYVMYKWLAGSVDGEVGDG